MSLAHGRVETRLPAKDLTRANRWYSEKLGSMLISGEAVK